MRIRGDPTKPGKSSALSEWRWLLLVLTATVVAVRTARAIAVFHNVMQRTFFGDKDSNSITPKTLGHLALGMRFNLSDSPYSSLTSRIVESLTFLSHSQANKLACQSLMDAARRHKTRGSETKDSVTAQQAAGALAYLQ